MVRGPRAWTRASISSPLNGSPQLGVDRCRGWGTPREPGANPSRPLCVLVHGGPNKMKRDARRLGVGTLLITVLIILASLFIMAMMQYFAGSVTKGKRILAHIAATDYANEAALDEAVIWFKGHCNNPQSK